MLDYVLGTSGAEELFYVGHSQGTVMGFAGFTLNQTLAKHIKAFFALAPVTTLTHIEGLFKVLANPFIYPELKVHVCVCTATLTNVAVVHWSPEMFQYFIS